MKITNALICSTGQKEKLKNESDEDFLKRLTHVQLNGKEIVKIENLSDCINMQVLYLYDNKITVIENLGFAAYTLTRLYLQNNQITSTKELGSLKKLKKLYLDNNCIEFVEGLQNLTELQELYLSNQTIKQDGHISFDQDSLKALTPSLQILSISTNKISKLEQIAELTNLRELNLSHNEISDVMQMKPLLRNCRYLSNLNMKENPITKILHYRKTITMLSSSLTELDGKELLKQNRDFLMSIQKQPVGDRSSKEEVQITPEVVQQISENRQLLRVLNAQKKIETKMKGQTKK